MDIITAEEVRQKQSQLRVDQYVKKHEQTLFAVMQLIRKALHNTDITSVPVQLTFCKNTEDFEDICSLIHILETQGYSISHNRLSLQHRMDSMEYACGDVTLTVAWT